MNDGAIVDKGLCIIFWFLINLILVFDVIEPNLIQSNLTKPNLT